MLEVIPIVCESSNSIFNFRIFVKIFSAND